MGSGASKNRKKHKDGVVTVHVANKGSNPKKTASVPETNSNPGVASQSCMWVRVSSASACGVSCMLHIYPYVSVSVSVAVTVSLTAPVSVCGCGSACG